MYHINSNLIILNCLLLHLVPPLDGLPNIIRIGALFDANEEEQELAFRLAVDRINEDPTFLPQSTLIAQVERSGKEDSFYVHKKTCSILRNGVAAIFGPLNGVTSLQVQSICDALEVPHLEARWDFQPRSAGLSVNLYPRASVFSRVYVDLVKAWEWSSFAIVFEENDGIFRMQDFFNLANKKYKWNIKVFQFSPNKPYRDTFWEIKKTGQTSIILDVKKENLLIALRHAQQIGLFTEQHHYLLTTLDLHSYDLEDFKHSKAKVTYIRLIDGSNPELRSLLLNWNSNAIKFGKRDFKEPHEILQTDSALIYDAVKLTATALKELDRSQRVDVQPLTCENDDQWVHGSSLVNYMRPISFRGLTGVVAFDESGFRSGTTFDVLEMTEAGFSRVGLWSELGFGGTNLNMSDEWAKHYNTFGLQNKTLIVTTILQQPYTMRKDSYETKSGNDEFEGFAIDLIDELSKILHFKYTIRLVADKKHGGLNKDGTWNGMVGEVMRGIADIAVADLTINSKRETAVDFTYPFLNTGIGILYKKPKEKDFSLFAFLDPFTITVWIYMLAASIGVTVFSWIVGRFTPYEWDNPHPCRQDDQILENNLGMQNSFWFGIGSLMQQGCDVAPKALSTRTISSIWYFFTLIIISSYTANLAAFLTIEKTIYPINNEEDLAKQEKIKYGCLRGGSTFAFFQESNFPIFKKMGEFMNKYADEVLVSNNDEGVMKVEKDNGAYAFLMESTSIEYVTERECNLTQIGNRLDNKFYGIATKKNNPIRNILSQGILKLQESGKLHVLKDRWWRQKKGGGKCAAEASKSSSTVPELTLNNVGGVFVVLLGGAFVAFLISIGEFLWKARKNAGKDNALWFEYMIQDLKYIMDCQSSTKPVIRKQDLKSQSKSMSKSKSKSKSITPQDQIAPSQVWNHTAV